MRQSEGGKRSGRREQPVDRPRTNRMSVESSAIPIPPSSRAGHCLALARRLLDRLVTRVALYYATAGYAALLFNHLWISDIRGGAAWRVLGDWLAFMADVFQFHIGLGAMTLAILALLARRARTGLLLAPLAGWALAPAALSLVPRDAPVLQGPTLSIMSVNLQKRNYRTRPLISQIRETAPDVLLLQEYTPAWRMALEKALAMEYPYRTGVARVDSYGVAIYSRLPLLEEQFFALPRARDDYPQLRATIELNGAPLVLYNVHLRSPGSIGSVLTQRAQVADLLALLAEESRPCVVAGDLNATGQTAFLRELGKLGWRDAHELAGRGRGATWPMRWGGRWLPGIRLDHILLGPGLAASASWTGAATGSDHRAVNAVVGKSEPRP